MATLYKREIVILFFRSWPRQFLAAIVILGKARLDKHLAEVFTVDVEIKIYWQYLAQLLLFTLLGGKNLFGDIVWLMKS